MATVQPPIDAFGAVLTPNNAKKLADALEAGLRQHNAYMPEHKRPAIKKRIEHLRAWAKQELS